MPGNRLSEDYVRRLAGIAYLWGWPMVNMHNRKLILSQLPEPGLMGGIVPVAPMNQLCMVHDYIDPGERLVACPNQDVAASQEPFPQRPISVLLYPVSSWTIALPIVRRFNPC
jgi:hypothetical protein